MNSDMFTVIILAVIFLFLLVIFDTGEGLILLFFICVLSAYFFTSIFTITDTTFIQFFRTLYTFFAIFSIVKSYYMKEQVLGRTT